jgi:valyl-tRNA synthetase
MLAALADLVDDATDAFEAYDYARALERTETFFWTFCDDYLELVKGRAYGSQGEEGQASAVTALQLAIDVFVRLFAPVIPFATEEVWSWTHDGSVHTAPWPTVDELGVDAQHGGLLPLASQALIGIRRAKTDAKASQKTPVTSAVIAAPSLLELAAGDLAAVGRIESLTFTPADEVAVVSIELGEIPQA